MKKIGIDARLYSQTGVGTYLKNLIYYLEKKQLENELFYIYLLPGDYDSVSFKNKNIIKRKVNYSWHSVGEQLGFAIKLYQDNLDLMHFTYFSYPVLYWRKFVATVHDTTPLLFKTGKASTKNQLIYNIKHLFFRIILRCQVRRAVKIITPTETVKKQLKDIYGNKISDKISPIYEGVNYQIIEAKENKNLNKKFSNFFIYVGNFYPHKNVEKLIEAFKKINKKYKLILIGPKDFFTARILRCIDTSNQNKNILLLTNSSLADLVFFYKNALALIHPSLSEGFGLPLIETTYFNTPVIASNIKVFQELLGNDYLSFNPKDTNDIAKKIKNFIKKKPEYDYKNIINKFSFENMTNKTLKIYKEVLYGN
ncbi:MAG: glycosyltransferase family 1 protein [Patescibacteria group bacterium]|jgi:glycosyltransferase involved in cell wall biosynthesis